MATESQIIANRINAQSRTEPKTAEGKARVARNAIKHGLFARTVILDDENPNEFDKLDAETHEAWNPVGAKEGALVQDIFVLKWPILRAHRIEADKLSMDLSLAKEHQARPADRSDRTETKCVAQSFICLSPVPMWGPLKIASNGFDFFTLPEFPPAWRCFGCSPRTDWTEKCKSDWR